jgi:hypothetical protein
MKASNRGSSADRGNNDGGRAFTYLEQEEMEEIGKEGTERLRLAMTITEKYMAQGSHINIQPPKHGKARSFTDSKLFLPFSQVST